MKVPRGRSGIAAPPGRNAVPWRTRLLVQVALVERVPERQPHVRAAERSFTRSQAPRGARRARSSSASRRSRWNSIARSRCSSYAALGEEAGADQLREGAACHVVVALLAHDPIQHRAGRGDPTEPQPGADVLRERVDVDHVLRRHRAQRRHARRPRAGDRRRRVLEDEEPVAAGQLAAGARAARATRSRPVGFCSRGWRTSSRISWRRRSCSSASMSSPSSSVGTDEQPRARVARTASIPPMNDGRLARHDVTRSQYRARRERQRLMGAGGDDDLLGADRRCRAAVPRRASSSRSSGIALDVGVLERARTVLPQRVRGQLGDALDRKQVATRDAPPSAGSTRREPARAEHLGRGCGRRRSRSRPGSAYMLPRASSLAAARWTAARRQRSFARTSRSRPGRRRGPCRRAAGRRARRSGG